MDSWPHVTSLACAALGCSECGIEPPPVGIYCVDRTWRDQPKPQPKTLTDKFLATFDEASWRIKAAWRALRHGEGLER